MTRRKLVNGDFHYQQCPGCGFDVLTGEGERSCGWYECPYLPEELKVCCPRCNFNFATGEGSMRCSDPSSCTFALTGRRNARLARQSFEV